MGLHQLQHLLHRIILFKRVRAKCFAVESDRGAHILQRFLVGVTLAHHHSVDTQGVSHIPIGMALHNNLQPLG